MGWDLVLVGISLLAFALVSRRLRDSPISAAMVFVTTGLVLGTAGLDIISTQFGAGTIKALAELTLALVLFTDAATIDTTRLEHEARIPARLLLIGLPLTIVAGTIVGLPLFGQLGVFEVAVLAILLAPTDAALGALVVSDERLPSDLRQGLNVESGLNDGICVPLLFAAIAFAEVEQEHASVASILGDLVKEVAVATAVGVAVGVAVSTLLRLSRRHGFIDGRWTQVVPLTAIAIAYAGTTELGGSGFVAAFAAGLAYRFRSGAEDAEDSVRLSEELGGLLSAVTFFVFGAVVVDAALHGLTASDVVYALLSLTVVRMLPVAVAMIGTGARWPTVAFAGWFGPRGLATIVFALIIVIEAHLPGTATIVRVATLTVLLSVFAHGITAPLLTKRYTAWLHRDQPAAVGPSQS